MMIKTTTSKIPATFLLVQMFLLSAVSAHPGPEGHTHPDEWPFEMLALLGVMIFSAFVFKLAWKKS
ncbi:hypothetical protein V2O64_12090 [Verrucomicrobiaceae bacterium 227]